METVTPHAAPTAHLLARQTAELAAISAQCFEMLQLGLGVLRQAMEATLGMGHENFGAARMGEIISWMPSEIRADVEHDGFVKWCFETAPRLQAEGLSFGFDGPSFDCAKASSAAEHVICDDPKLWGPDRAVAALYSHHRQQATADLRGRLRDARRAWIGWPDGCEADTACVAEAYRQRLKDFGLE